MVVRRPAQVEPAVVAAHSAHNAPMWTVDAMMVALQRADETGETASEPAEAAAPAMSAPSPSAAPESSQPPLPPDAGPQEPEELLKTLFDPLLRKLRTELRLDRERRGEITDRW